MSRWLDRAEQLTYEGERVTETVEAGTGGVVVTTHRVLVFTPDGEGEAFTDVDLPNVTGITQRERGERRFVMIAAQAGLLGTILVLGGVLLPLDSLVGDVSIGTGANQLGIGGVMGLMRSLLGILQSLDTILLVLGALAFAVGIGALGWYLQTRERQLLIQRAGDDPLSVPLGDDTVPQAMLQRLRDAIQPDP